MKKLFTLAILAIVSICSASAAETDVTTLPWVDKGQTCTVDLNNPNAGTAFGTDAGGSSISYVDLSEYGQLNMTGAAGQTVRLFLNRAEAGDANGIFYVEFDAEGKATFDFNTVLEKQPNAQYIHLNGIKASAWNTKADVSTITVSGTAIAFPEVFQVPEGEYDITKLSWVNNGQGLTNNIGAEINATIYGTDAGPDAEGKLSYVDASDYGQVKIYGNSGENYRLFINRAEYPDNFQFYVSVGEDGCGVLDLKDVYDKQGCSYIHINGIKTNWCTVKSKAITLAGTAPWSCPEGEIEYATLEGFKDINNIGKSLNGGDVVFGNQSSGDDYTDVTDYKTVKFYGTPGAMLRVFANRVGGEGVTVGKNEQRITIGEDGIGVLDVKAVMEATEKNYCRLSGIKICAAWQGATVDQNIVIKGITVVAEATAISAVSTNAQANGVAYNLAGQRVAANAKGLVIINGKKFIK